MDLTLPSFLTLDEYASLAPQVPRLTALTAATDDQRVAEFASASADINVAMKYQGRKLDPSQALEFPRLKGELLSRLPSDWYDLPCLTNYAELWARDIWDWDADAGEAIVPVAVKIATMHQANAGLDGTLANLRARLASGLTAQSTGSLSETYRQGNLDPAADVLCPSALAIMTRYRLRSGRLL